MSSSSISGPAHSPVTQKSLSSIARAVSTPSTDSTTHTGTAKRSDLRTKVILVSMGAFLLLAMLLAFGIGAVSISAGQVLSILAANIGLDLPWEYTERQAIVLNAIRIPRVLLGVLVGAGLSLSGALMQGLFRNPLADPGLIGVSSGSALGAASMIVLGAAIPGLAASVFGPMAIAAAAFAGGLVVTIIVYKIATHGFKTSVVTMLLAGIALNAICSAGIGLLILVSDDDQLRDLTFWTLGSLGGATWNKLAVVFPFVLVTLVAAPYLSRALNALLLGEAEARHLGVRLQKIKRLTIGLAAMAVGAATAVSGLIGFVGLVVPHLARIILGPDHKTLLPASALLGAGLLVAADLISRIVISPAEVPIGIITALAGAPFFLILLLRNRDRDATSF